jgi:hypothetical protein
MGADGSISLYKEYYNKKFLPKVSKFTQEVYHQRLPRVRKLLSEKLKELNEFSKEGKLDLYDSQTLTTSHRLAHALISSNSAVDHRDEHSMNLLHRHYLKEELKDQDKCGSKHKRSSYSLAQSFVDKGIACSVKMPKNFKKVIQSKYGIKDKHIAPYFNQSELERENLIEEYMAQNEYNNLFSNKKTS